MIAVWVLLKQFPTCYNQQLHPISISFIWFRKWINRLFQNISLTANIVLVISLDVYGNEGNAEQFHLEIHSDAFVNSNTRNFTEMFKIENCDMLLLNFTFLTEFNQLNTLYIENSFHVHLRNLPPLLNLVRLYLRYTNGLSEWTDFPKLINGLYELDLIGNRLLDEEIDRVLKWIFSGPSSNTLGVLDVGINSMSQIPNQIKLNINRSNITKINASQSESNFSRFF